VVYRGLVPLVLGEVIMPNENTAVDFDPTRAEAFAGRFLSALNDAGLCLMASVGHRTGLFDCMRGLAPSTPAEIAAKAGLNERYVREWLGALVTAGVVEIDPTTNRYRLPPEHAAFLTRAAAADNIAVFAQYIPLLGSVEDDIVECFRMGGGVPYEKFPRFHAVMAEDSGQSVLSALESHVVPLVPGLAGRLAAGIRVLDVGCGSGRIMIRLAEIYPNSRFVGVDLSAEAIQRARQEASGKRLRNAEFVAADLSDFHRTSESEAFDLITTFDAVHDQAKPRNVLRGIYRALKSDGVYIMQDIRASSSVHNNVGHPIGTLLYTVSCMHCMTVSLAQGGEGLGAMWGEEKTREYLEQAGFGSIETHRLDHDIQNNWYVVRK
jgi:ubiquinone/menaquinone biosynthesis C-methylase UbiE